jgi:regulator of replication initiation timing
MAEQVKTVSNLDPNAAMQAALLNVEESIECLQNDIMNVTESLGDLKVALRGRLQEQTRLRTALGLSSLHPRKKSAAESAPEAAAKQDQEEG